MATKPKQKITAWSYSRYNLYCQCPFKFKCKHIDRLPEPQAAPLLRGIEIHKLAEDYTKGKIKKLPNELTNFRKEFDSLRESFKLGNVEVEGEWAFDPKWSPVDWFSKDTWLRIKIDAGEVARDDELDLIDHKTGKIRGEYDEQLELYACGAFSIYDGLKKVNTKLWFLDHGEVVEDTFKVASAPALRKDWERRVKRMMLDTRFDPKPNQYCYNCHFRKDNGGPCKF